MRLRRYQGLIPLVMGCAAIALVLYSLIQPRSSLGPIHSDHIFEHDGNHGHCLRVNLRDAVGVLPARPHPLPFKPDDLDYVNRITKRKTYHLSTNAQGFRGITEYERTPTAGVTRIGTIGDSITFGYGVADDKTYPALLEKALSEHGQYEVINAGVHGYDSAKGLHALTSRLLPLEPHIVTICVGVNDTVSIPEHAQLEGGLLRLSVARYHEIQTEYRGNLLEMLRHCEDQGVQVVLVLPPVNSFFPFPDVERIQAVTRRVAKDRGLPLIDLQTAFRAREEQDGIVLFTEDDIQTLVRYRKGEPQELLSVEVDPGRFQYVADEVYDYIDSHPVDMVLSYDGSHPNAEGMKVIAGLLEEAILEMEP